MTLPGVYLLFGLMGGLAAPVAPLRSQVYFARPGETSHEFAFHVKNPNPEPIEVASFQTSCGCTTFEAPPGVWSLRAGSDSVVVVRLNFEGRHGKIVRQADLNTTAGPVHLTIEADVP